MIIKSFKDISNLAWDDFVFNHPHANFFQTSYYFNLYLNNNKASPVAYALINEDAIVGVILGVIFHNYCWPLSEFTRRAIIIGGPLIKNNNQEFFNSLLHFFCEREKDNCTYIQLRNLWDIRKDNYNFEKLNFTFESHLDILHDLSEEETVITKKISKSKLANVRKSLNKGTLVKEINTDTDFKTGVDLIISTYKKIGLPCPTSDFFLNTYKKLNKSGYLKSFGAYSNDKLIAMRVEICYKSQIYDWYTGHLPEYSNRYANDLLPFHILLWGKRNGFQLFDFGGAGKPDVPYGVRDHKLKFGGTLVNYGRYERINKKVFMMIFKLGYRLIKKK